jgi:signal transduction histidine kinase
MTGAPAILLVDSRGSDRTLTRLLLQHQLPHAVITEARDAVTLSDALAADAPDVALVAADVAWSSPNELVETIRRCRPQTAVVLFGHQADIARRVLNPGVACDGVIRKSSAGFLALGSIISSALERIGARKTRLGMEAAAISSIATTSDSITDERDPDEDRREIALLFSHDLREPVQQLVRLARQGQTEDAQSMRRVLSHVLERAERLSTMLDGMTEYLIVEGRAATRGVIDLKACLDKAVDNLRTSIAETHAEIRAAGERLMSVGDEQQMIHLFQNLVSNAIKFRNGDHAVISVSAERCGDRWLMRFQDNGIGIPEASTSAHACTARRSTRERESDSHSAGGSWSGTTGGSGLSRAPALAPPSWCSCRTRRRRSARQQAGLREIHDEEIRQGVADRGRPRRGAAHFSRTVTCSAGPDQH